MSDEKINNLDDIDFSAIAGKLDNIAETRKPAVRPSLSNFIKKMYPNIKKLHNEGHTYNSIAEILNESAKEIFDGMGVTLTGITLSRYMSIHKPEDAKPEDDGRRKRRKVAVSVEPVTSSPVEKTEPKAEVKKDKVKPKAEPKPEPVAEEVTTGRKIEDANFDA